MCFHMRSVTLRTDPESSKEFIMDAIVVYESVFGNTRAVAEAIAEGLGSAPVLSVHEAAKRSGSVDLLVVGGPTHMHGLSTTRSRRLAAEGAHEDGAGHVEPSATDEPGLGVVATESFLVENTEGPLEEGELEPARAWGAELARSVAATAEHPVEA